jgi:hypothetical protein
MIAMSLPVLSAHALNQYIMMVPFRFQRGDGKRNPLHLTA